MKSMDTSTPEKKQIYFARTYRHLQINRARTAIFLLLFILPALILLLFFYDELTYLMCRACAYAVQASGGPQPSIATSVFIPMLGPVYYLDLPTVYPDYHLILMNLAVALVMVWVLSSGPQKGRPIAIYLSINLFTHIMACVFFLLGRDQFPYTLADYSDLYMKQQIGIWITFLVLIGLIMGFLSKSGLMHRILIVVSVMLYSFVFGLVRYILFTLILMRFSVLYMPLMFFSLGPFFDFLYFVAIYAISTNKMIYIYDSEKKEEWLWA